MSKTDKWQELVECTYERASLATKRFKAGQVKFHLPFWKKLTSDRNILSLVAGVHIELVDEDNCSLPPEREPYRVEERQAIRIQTEIEKMVKKGIVRECSRETGQVISPIFTRPKKDGGLRIILDLSDLNKSVVYRHFKMDTFGTALNLISRNCFMASIDWKDAYYSIPVALNDRKLLRFKWNQKIYEFTALPNGLSSAPRVFTKITKVLFSELRKNGHQNTSYLDDCLLVGESCQECQNNVAETVRISEEAGFVIHPEKSVLFPTQNITYLGFVIDSVEMRVTLTPERGEKLKFAVQQSLAPEMITIHQLAQLVGLMVASFPGVEHAQLFYRRCDNLKTKLLKLHKGEFKTEIRLTPECREDLTWWLSNIASSYSPIERKAPRVTVTSDASRTAWGAVTDNEKTGGNWSIHEQKRVRAARSAPCHQVIL